MYGAPVAPKPFADIDQGQAGGVQLGGLPDLRGRQGMSAARYAFSFQESRHGPPVDPELLGQLVDGRACFVADDQLLDLLRPQPSIDGLGGSTIDRFGP